MTFSQSNQKSNLKIKPFRKRTQSQNLVQNRLLNTFFFTFHFLSPLSSCVQYRKAKLDFKHLQNFFEFFSKFRKMDEKEPEASSSQKSETKDEKPAPRRSTRKKMNKVSLFLSDKLVYKVLMKSPVKF